MDHSNAVRKERNGHIIHTCGSEIGEADAQGKFLRFIRLPPGQYTDIEDVPGGGFIAACAKTGRVLEVDAMGKALWKADVPGTCGVTRLPNGHTLVGADHRIIELDDRGKTVWEKQTEGYVRRIRGW
jgi:hypothetical protein